MATFKDQLVAAFDRYVEEVDSEPTSLHDVADWALAQGLYRPSPKDVRKMCREALAESLRQEKRWDGKRWYRAKQTYRSSIGGVQLSLWADIDKNASFGFMQKSVSQQRKAIVDDAYSLKMVVDHFNENHEPKEQLSLVLDFKEDVAELEAARREDDKGKGAA